MESYGRAGCDVGVKTKQTEQRKLIMPAALNALSAQSSFSENRLILTASPRLFRYEGTRPPRPEAGKFASHVLETMTTESNE
jgi:hypothetical protein